MSKCRIYTDGSCIGNPGCGGWAAVFSVTRGNNEKNGILKGGDPYTTNNKMELLAVVKSIEKALTVKSIDCIEIHSDSSYVVNAVNQNWIVQWKLRHWKTTHGIDVVNKELWQKLDSSISLARSCGIDVVFVKVKGHSGDPLNEYVDMLAKKESSKQERGE